VWGWVGGWALAYGVCDTTGQTSLILWIGIHFSCQPRNQHLPCRCRYDAFATVMEILAARLRYPGVPPEV
jgi:hypothetical protein